MDNTATQSAPAANQIISDLMHALDVILREADRPEAKRDYREARAALSFIAGAASQAMKTCDAQRERNSDGYLVVKESR